MTIQWTKISWVFRVVAAAILLQTLYFKFSGHPESVALFTKLGVEPWGRIGTGVIELIAAVLILLPGTVFWGAFLALGLMGGAIMSHLFVIGIESNGDGGYLFILGIVTLICASITLVIFKNTGLKLIRKFV